MNIVAKENKSVLLGTATNYWLDSLGIESWWGWDFPHLSRPAVSHPASYTMRTCYSWRVKQLGHCIDHPPWSSAKVKEYSYTSIPLLSLWTFMVCSRVNFLLYQPEREWETNIQNKTWKTMFMFQQSRKKLISDIWVVQKYYTFYTRVSTLYFHMHCAELLH